MDKILLEADLIKNQIDELERTGTRHEEKMKRLETSWKSLISKIKSDVVICTKTQKFLVHKNVLGGKTKFNFVKFYCKYWIFYWNRPLLEISPIKLTFYTSFVAGSPVFDGMFRSGMKESSTNETKIDDFDDES